MIKAVLFDSDGTLIDTNELIIKSFKNTLKTHCNLELEEKDIVKYFGEPLQVTMQRFDKENAECLVDAYRKFNEELHDDMVAKIEGVQEGLIKLKSMGIKTAVVTSKRKRMVTRELKMFDIYEYFDVIVTPEDTEIHKPFADPALKACELLKVKPGEAMMVGDSHNDILCGKRAGCYTCLVNYTVIPKEEILKHNPDYSVDNLSEIAEIIENI